MLTSQIEIKISVITNSKTNPEIQSADENETKWNPTSKSEGKNRQLAIENSFDI